ncbi:MAG: hypothetical protein COB85_04620 [Bacteroidetes bacterium]|nr:MAG: hypothetical protein COB85_04620 [Bacteroidota bacterium]
MNAGGSGSLGGYSFAISKDSLEKAIYTIIRNNKNITKLEVDADSYIKILIATDDSCYFLVRFYDDEEYWKSHPNNSEFFITAVKKGSGSYKSEGEISERKRKELLWVFENHFINPLSRKIGVPSLKSEK